MFTEKGYTIYVQGDYAEKLMPEIRQVLSTKRIYPCY